MPCNKQQILWVIALLCAISFSGRQFNSVVVGASIQSGQEKGGQLVEVEAKYVCMINKRRFDNEQIPVKVDGRTYYGCCDMCKTRLQEDPKSRIDVDPVSGKEVDKAKAVIGAASDGTVYFFENADNLKKFRPGSAKKTDK